MRPLFVLSAPRSGSTLVQRILGAHSSVATVSEPWLLLPLLYAMRRRGVYAEYTHGDLARALEDFQRELPRGSEDWRAAVRGFALDLYTRVSGGAAEYFLDKTPRYNLVLDELFATFPDARFVFVFRNPLAVVASLMRTFGGGRWNLHYFKADLFAGVANLAAAYRERGGGAAAVRYEDLLVEPRKQVRRLFENLGLPFEERALASFAEVPLRGRMGDKSDAHGASIVRRDPLEAWKRELANPLRKAWCRRYLRWLGQERLALLGYERRELLAQLEAIPTSARGMASDAVRITSGALYCAAEPRLFRHKLERLPHWRNVHPHR